MRYRDNAAAKRTKKLQKAAQDLVVRKAKEEINVIHRTIGEARPIVSMVMSSTVFRNGKPLVYPKSSVFVIDPGHSAYARSFASAAQPVLKTNFKLKDQ